MEKKKEYILSICIPTYNRMEYLHNLLDGLLPQMKIFKDKVSLHITDNASIDNTVEMIRELSVRYDIPIDLYQQNENVGLERNYEKASSMTDGRYTFILGDDDLLAPNFIKTILDYIDVDDEFSLIHFNWIHADMNYNAQYVQNWKYIPETYMNVDEFFLKVMSSPNFTSSVIFNTKLWTLGLPDEGEFDGGGYWGFARIIKGACKFQKPCIYHHYPLVIQRNPIRSFEAMWPYYNFVDMSKIFKMSEKYIPGIFVYWRDNYVRSSYSNYIIEGIKYNIPFYKEYRSEMETFLSKKQMQIYDFILNSRNPMKAYRKWTLRELWRRRILKIGKFLFTHKYYADN